MSDHIYVAILDDHQSIIDGYLYRLSSAEDIVVAVTLRYGNDLLPALAVQPVDVLILDISLPCSPTDPTPFPLLTIIPKILHEYPDLAIVIITMFAQRTLIRAMVDSGVLGYILKEDAQSLRDLANVVRTVNRGDLYFPPQVEAELAKTTPRNPTRFSLTDRQKLALSLCAAFPDESLDELAERMCIAPPSLRNLLSRAYVNMDVRGRQAAVIKASQAGLLIPFPGDGGAPKPKTP